jgi:diacylglycerol kinase family enzyme
MWRALSQKARIVRHSAISAFEDATTLTARSRDDRAVHLQVDGDYIGEITEARFSVVPEGLSVVS